MDKLMSPSEIYTTMMISRTEVIDEKSAMFEDYLKIYFNMMYKFNNNKILLDVLSYISEYFKLFIEDANFEHEVYDRVIQFFDDLDVIDLDEDYNDKEMLLMLSNLIEHFDVACEKRLLEFAKFCNFYEVYIEKGWMDKRNYQYVLYDDEHLLDDCDKEQILSLFPKKRHED